MNEEQPSAEQPIEAPFVEAPPSEAPQVKRQPQDPRSRLRELLAIPERDRADEVWDEIISLEIDMAPGNRANSPQPDGGRRQDSGQQRQQQGRRQNHQQAHQQDPSGGKRQGKRFFQKRKRGPGASGGQSER